MDIEAIYAAMGWEDPDEFRRKSRERMESNGTLDLVHPDEREKFARTRRTGRTSLMLAGAVVEALDGELPAVAVVCAHGTGHTEYVLAAVREILRKTGLPLHSWAESRTVIISREERRSHTHRLFPSPYGPRAGFRGMPTGRKFYD